MNDNLIVPITRNRIEEGVCIYCGEELLAGVSCEMGMHTECRKKVEVAARKQIANRKEREGKVKRIKIKIPEKHLSKKP